MGLFGLGKAKVCPLCGEEYKGLLGGEKTRDGEVCAECWSKFKSVSRDLISEYTAEQVRGIIEGGEVLKNGTCGVCGKATDLDALPIADGIICRDCAKILRGCYYNYSFFLRLELFRESFIRRWIPISSYLNM